MPESVKQLFCPVRQQWVAALPEEQVRQNIIRLMVEEREFPLPLLAVEKSVRDLLPFTQASRGSIPNRRVDLVAYRKTEAQLLPLLLMECKAIPLAESVLQQLAGYNHFVQAPFISLANQLEVRTGWFDASYGNYRFVTYLPHYEQLLRSV